MDLKFVIATFKALLCPFLSGFILVFLSGLAFGSAASASGTTPLRSCTVALDEHAQKDRLTAITLPAAAKPQQYIIGFSRDKNGKIKPLYSDSKDLHSLRDLGDSIFSFMGGGWNPVRKMEILPLRLVSPKNQKIDSKSEEFDLLPASLRQVFASGKVLVTDGLMPKQSEYQVLMATAPSSSKPEGRTGVLMQNGKPLIVELRGKEYLVEIKGVGAPEGDFDYQYNNNRGFIRGGIEADFAHFEFESNKIDRRTNRRFQEGNSVIAAGVLSFDSPQGRQGYLIRLSPGSVRASYRKNTALSRLDSMTGILAQKFGEVWGDMIGRGLVPLSHYENLVALDDLNDFTMTDYQDVVPIGVFPYEDRTPENAARDALGAVKEVPGFKDDLHFDLFKSGLIKGLNEGHNVTADVIEAVKTSKTTREMAKILWERFLVLLNFRQRSEFGWLPQWLEYSDFYEEKNVEPSFTEASVRKLIQNYSRNQNEILAIRERIDEAKKTFIKSFNEYQKLKTDQKARDAWKAEQLKKNTWWDNQQAEWEVEHHMKLLESVPAVYREWIHGEIRQIRLLEFRNRGLEETGFTLQGLLATVQSKAYIESIASGDSYKSKYTDLPTGSSLSQLLILRDHLKEEIEWLQQAAQIALAGERAEIAKNISIAHGRLSDLSKIGPYEFYALTLKDPDFILVQALLPYHSKHFSINLLRQSEVFKKVGKIIERLKAANRI